MCELLVNILTTAISGCIITSYAYWLRKRNDK
ncbi:type I toxin-antitoxin system Fst family toxin [Staphylococcus xylosus]